MAVRFVLGRAGTGKTRYCVREIAAALRADPIGPPIYWIVPRQATFSSERTLTCAAGLPGYCRARVVSYELLVQQVLAECGGIAVPEVTPLGRLMVLSHLLRRHRGQLAFYRDVAHHPGLAVRLDAVFGELEHRGHDPQVLDDLVAQLERADLSDSGAEMLLPKMRDVRLLYAAYRYYLGQERLDPHGRQTQMLQRMSQAPSLAGASVFVDGFNDFRQTEQRVLVRLATVARSVQICLIMDPDSLLVAHPGTRPDEMSLMHRCEQTYHRLRKALVDEGVTVEAPLALREAHRFRSPALAGLERTFGDPRSANQDCGGVIEFIEAPDRRGEVAAAANRIRELLVEGLRLREIAVLVRDLDDYHELIDAAFVERSLPCFIDRRRPAMHHPLLQLVRSALSIVRQDWPHDAVMTLAKCGLSGLSDEQADELENYVLMHRIRGKAWVQDEAWAFRRELTRSSTRDDTVAAEPDESQRMDLLRRRLADPLREFETAAGADGEGNVPVRRIAAALFELIERLGVRRTLAGWMRDAERADRYEQRDEHEQVWAELVGLLEQMVDLLGDEEVKLDDFAQIVEAGLERFDFAVAPPTLDQVLVGEVDRTRATDPKVVLVLGLNEGVFPRVPSQDSILADGERDLLQKRGVETDPDSTRRLLDERFLGYIAFTRPSSRLIVTRATGGADGKPLGPSPLWLDLRRRFPEAILRQIPRDPGAQNVGSARQLVSGLTGWVRAGASDDPPSPWPALYEWLAAHPCCGDAIDLMRHRAWRALGYSNDAHLSSAVARRLFRSPLHSSVTQIETYAACPYKHFAAYGLKLRLREEPDLTALDLGNLCHSVLEQVVRQVLALRADWCTLQPKLTDQMVHGFCEQIGQTLRGELMLSSARNKYVLQHVERTLSQLLAAQQAAMRCGRFRPAAAEVGFGVDGGRLDALVLATPRGSAVHLHGKVERIDVNERTWQCAVIDYKLTGDKLALQRVYHGLALQLLTYLLVLRENGAKLLDRPLTPVAAFYVQVLRRLKRVDHPGEAVTPDEPEFDLQIKPRGLFDIACAEDLDTALAGGASKVVSLVKTKDGRISRRGSDAVESAEFSALLGYVARRIGELADQIIEGQIAASPYRLGAESPCPHCDFRSVCRFDPAINRYNTLERLDVLAKVMEGGGHDA
jgi:ATP-dependent helicase/nuclease subunit B